MEDWPFDDPETAAAMTVQQITHGRKPILQVSRDADNGAWRFLASGSVEATDVIFVSLREMYRIDRSIAELADLPLGWQARRSSVGELWQRLGPAPGFPARERLLGLAVILFLVGVIATIVFASSHKYFWLGFGLCSLFLGAMGIVTGHALIPPGGPSKRGAGVVERRSSPGVYWVWVIMQILVGGGCLGVYYYLGGP